VIPIGDRPPTENSEFEENNPMKKAATLCLALTAATLLWIGSPTAQAQTFTVIRAFSGGGDGGNPSAGLTMRAGNLYGTAEKYGAAGYGTAYELLHSGSNWILAVLYTFNGVYHNDGANPSERLVFNPYGVLFGATAAGGIPDSYNAGTVFKLSPRPTICKTANCPWNESVLYEFGGPNDGLYPGDPIFDRSGTDIYGVTTYGVNFCAYEHYSGCGTVYELTPSGSGWTHTILYSFSGGDGALPHGSLLFDSAGNLYGTTAAGGRYSYGTVFEMMYAKGFGWSESLLYSFQDGGDGAAPTAGLISDEAGNLYGTTSTGGSGGGGSVFELSYGTWTLTTLSSFSGGAGCGPTGSLVMDNAGNIYGTTLCDGAYNLGNVFKLTPSGNGWTYTSLYDFTGGNDGGKPIGNVTIDATDGTTLYGTASTGGSQTVGVIWMIKQ
jgi:uncharacterized repeat protein (TIGR03803 family)